jgi:dephospho-CoA kinase
MAAHASSGILTIGVTGGIGSGKSLVCIEFAALGIPVLPADDIAKSLSQHDAALRAKLTKILGPGTYRPDGTYNRPYVASKIFADKKLKARVEAAVHPAVTREIKRRIAELKADHHAVVIIEAALIFEAEYDTWLDGVLVVEAAEKVRIARASARDGLTEEQVRSRMAAQMDPAESVEHADYVLRNNGTPEELRERVRFFAAMFHALAASKTT